MKITKKTVLIFISFILVACCVLWCAFLSTPGKQNNMVPRDGFITYHTADTILFNQSGNSDQYISGNVGWGAQEPKHRCIVGKHSELKLFVADADGSDLRLLFNGFGARAPDTPCQDITVYANNTVVAQWCAASRDIYTAIIPGTLVPDGNLHIRFDIANPYVSENDPRPLGAAVREITLEKMHGNQTKKKLSLWLQKRLWGGPVQNPYALNNATTEKSK